MTIFSEFHQEKKLILPDQGLGIFKHPSISPLDLTEAHLQELLGIKKFIDPRDLPIYPHLPSIVEAVLQNDIVIICSETGSGKTTQVLQALARAGFLVHASQPKRFAAALVKSHIESQYGGENGSLVGFKHALAQQAGKDAEIIIYTDGFLLQKILTEGWFKNHGFKKQNKQPLIVLDEVHEFNENIEAILALYEKYRRQGTVPKLVIMSATMDIEKLTKYFNPKIETAKNIPVFNIPGRMFNITYLPTPTKPEDAYRQLNEIGPFTSFLPGMQEFAEAQRIIKKAGIKAKVLPLHSKQTAEEQARVDQKYEINKIILSTSVGQTSVTIDDLKSVLINGKERAVFIMDDEEYLLLKDISQHTARQQAGRASRTQPGFCMNLGKPFSELPVDDYFQIQNSLLESLVLRLLVAKEDPTELNFLHQPSNQALENALNRLERAGFIDQGWEATELGEKATSFPMSPRSSKMLIKGMELLKDKPELIQILIDLVAINEANGIVEGSFKVKPEMFPKEYQSWLPKSDYFMHFLLLEKIFSIEDKQERNKFLNDNKIDKSALKRISDLRKDISKRVETKVGKLGTRDLSGVDIDLLHKAVCRAYEDNIYYLRYHDTNMYDNLDRPCQRLKKLNRSSFVKNSFLVYGRPYGIETSKGIMSMLTFATAIPNDEIQNNPKLKEKLDECLNIRKQYKKSERLSRREKRERDQRNKLSREKKARQNRRKNERKRKSN